MSDIAIRRPMPVERRLNGNLQTLLGGSLGFSEGPTNVIYNGAFCYIDSSGYLAEALTVSTAPVLSGSGTVYNSFVQVSQSGQTGINPPYCMHGDGSTFAPRYWPLDINGMIFAMNITDASFNIGLANGAPPLSEAIMNKAFGLIVGGSTTPAPAGNYTGVWAVNVDDTTNPDVRVVDIPQRWQGVDQSALTTSYNGIVLVQFLNAKLQINA